MLETSCCESQPPNPSKISLTLLASLLSRTATVCFPRHASHIAFQLIPFGLTEMEPRHEKGFENDRYPPISPSSRFEQQLPQSSGQNRQQYSPPPFHKIQHDTRKPSIQDMSGVPLHAFRPIYDNNWQLPQSPPKSIGGQSPPDTTRSRLEDERLVRPNGRLPQRHHHPGNKERPRVTRFKERSPSLGYDSDESHERRRRSRKKRRSRTGRSHNGSRAGNQTQPPPPQQVSQQKTGLETIITPLRLGILLGCFDIIGGSLSVWMTRKRFGQAAAQQAAAAGGAQQQQAGGGGSDHRSRLSSKYSHRRGEDRRPYHPYDSESLSEDSDYDERQRRTAEHVREQRRLEYERERGLGRPSREVRDVHLQHGRRR